MTSDSTLFGVSIRAWLAVMLIGTVCGLVSVGKEIKEPLYSMATLALGFYFGQKGKIESKITG